MNATKTGASNDNGAGGNIFNGTSIFTNTGSGQLLFGNNNADQFNGSTTFNNNGSYRIYIAYNHTGQTTTFGSDVTFNTAKTGGADGWSYLISESTSSNVSFAGNVTYNCSGTLQSNCRILQGTSTTATYNGIVTINLSNANVNTQIQMGSTGISTYNSNIIVNNTGGASGVYFNTGATASSTLASGQTISIGSGGFNSGNLSLIRFTQLGTTAQNLSLSGTAALLVGPTSAFGGNVTFSAPAIFLNGCTYSGTSSFTKTGATGDYSNGGNTFTGISTITNNGAGILYMANVATTPDNFITDVTATNSGTGALHLAYTAVGNTFGGNVFLNNTASGASNAVSICLNTNATAAISGNLNINNTGSGTNNTIYLANNNGTSVSVSGNLTLTHSSSGTGNNIAYIGQNGSCSIAGNLNVTNASSGTSAYIAIANGTAASNVSVGGAVTINNTGSATSNNDIYLANNGTMSISGTTSIINNSTGAGGSHIYLTNGLASSSITFGGDATFSNIAANTGDAYFRNLNGSAVFNGNIVVNNTATTPSNNNGIYLCVSLGNTGTASLANGKTISVGSGGFTIGNLRLLNFTQIGGTAQSITLSGTATLQFGSASTFNGNITSLSPNLLFNGCTFNGTVNATQNGTAANYGTGGNTFNAACTITNSGSAILALGNGSADTWNSTAAFISNGSSNISLGYGSSGNTFNGNVTVSSSGSSTGITFDNNATASTTLASGNTISVGAGGFSSGTLLLQRFTQAGATAQSLTLTGSGILTFGPSSTFGGNVTSVSPDLYFNGCTFSGTSNCTKNGGVNDIGAGNNIFTGVSTITNSSTSGYLMFGNTSKDQWLSDVTFNNTGTNYIFAAYNSANNTFGGNVNCNNSSTGNAAGIYVCSNTNASASISGNLNCTNSGPTGNNNGVYIVNATGSSLSVAGNLTINNTCSSGTNSGIRICEGSNSVFSVAGTTSITNSNANTSNYIRFNSGSGSTSTFNGAVTVNNNGTAASTNVVHFGYAGTSIFNADITLNSTGGTGIYFGSNAGTSTQANNFSINTGTYTGGALLLRNFSQTGPATGNTSNVSITGTNMLLTFNGSTFYDNVIGASQEIAATNSTFNATTALTKVSGNANDYWNGGNTFNGTTTITNQSTLILEMANGTADTYNGNVSFVQSGTGIIRPSYNANCTYAGNISITCPAAVAMTFGSGAAGITTMNGSGAQTISLVSGLTPVFTQFVMNNSSAAGVTLNTPVNISTSLTTTNGLLNTPTSNILTMLSGSTASAITTSSPSYVNGPNRYQKSTAGASTLNFPIGTSPDCRPVVLTVNHSTATLYNYTAQLYIGSSFGFGYTTYPATVDTLSGVHYWSINRTDNGGVSQPIANLSGNQTVQLSFDANDQVYNGSLLTVCKTIYTSTTNWYDIGQGSTTIGTAQSSTPLAGTITSSASGPTAFNSFSYFTLGRINGTGSNPLPIELLSFHAVPSGENVNILWETSSESNNSYFTVERSADGVSFSDIAKVNSKAYEGNSHTPLSYQAVDTKPLSGVSYYRLKQTDLNGNFKFFNMVKIDFASASFVSIYPNPAVNSFFVKTSPDYDQAHLSCINAVGETILSQTIYASDLNTVNTSLLLPGMYYILIDNGQGKISKTKLVLGK